MTTCRARASSLVIPAINHMLTSRAGPFRTRKVGPAGVGPNRSGRSHTVRRRHGGYPAYFLGRPAWKWISAMAPSGASAPSDCRTVLDAGHSRSMDP